ncbi:MAG: nucleotide exchange factor GrpE [Candidatus Sungbacteria bacterium]|nr:nucleotide exchange factor GrpE [Candidatus Sungbacteria bacterium]
MDDLEINEEYGESAHPDPVAKIKQLKEKLAICENDKKEYLDGWQRAKADIINSRKDDEKRLRIWKDRLEDELILEFLSVLDSFDLALGEEHKKHLSNEAGKGFYLIQSQCLEILRRLGVEPLKTAGTKFDPELHEAIDEIESKDHEQGIIAEEMQRGYMRGGRVLRPAKVKVYKNVQYLIPNS